MKKNFGTKYVRVQLYYIYLFMFQFLDDFFCLDNFALCFIRGNNYF